MERIEKKIEAKLLSKIEDRIEHNVLEKLEKLFASDKKEKNATAELH